MAIGYVRQWGIGMRVKGREGASGAVQRMHRQTTASGAASRGWVLCMGPSEAVRRGHFYFDGWPVSATLARMQGRQGLTAADIHAHVIQEEQASLQGRQEEGWPPRYVIICLVFPSLATSSVCWCVCDVWPSQLAPPAGSHRLRHGGGQDATDPTSARVDTPSCGACAYALYGRV